MSALTRLLICTSLALLCSAHGTQGQSAKIENESNTSPVVTAKATGERVRFAAPGQVVQLRLEVMTDSGQTVFDVQARGNVLDWVLADTTGARLQDGTYVCLLTVKSLSGRLSQRIGSLEVRGQQITLQAEDPSKMSRAQQQSVGPLESQAAISVLPPDEARAVTTTLHDGAQGALTRTNGALSFRLGDLFAGEDAEQMRLTEEGNLGIGTPDPKAKLDVAGDIRSTGFLRLDKGIEFADGTVQNSGQSGRKRDDGTVAPNATGAGTQNRIAKWTDNAGTLGDSIMTDTGANVGLGVASPGDLLDIAGPPNASGRSGIHVRTTSSAGNSTMYFDNDRSNFAAYGGLLTGGSTNPFSFFGISRADRTFLFADGPSSLGLGIGTLVSRPVIFGTNNAERMRIESAGNVGIGTTTPAQKLDVAGVINTSTQYNVANARVLSVPGATNTFVGVSAGSSNTSGSGNSFLGNSAGTANSSGTSNSFVGSNAGMGNSSGGGNSFVGTDAGFTNSGGNFNSFFGNQAGRNNVASNNSFFGQNAGFGNTTGTFNSFFGLAAGFANNEGFYNSFFGYRAGAATSGPTASANSFFGNLAGEANSSGNSNAFFGASSGQMNNSGSTNSFFGTGAGFANTTAGGNTFIGSNAAMANQTGANNLVIGSGAGGSLVAGSNNIYLANAGADESNHIRIGTEGTQTATFIAGINGINVNPSTSVVVDSNGQLGVIVSSQRYKQDIRSMGEASSKLMRLRPVTFFYRPEYVTGEQTLQYGLIAEEVAKVYPDLVALGADGKPQTVRYHLLSTMLLNEVQKQAMYIRSQREQVQSLTQQIADLEGRLRRLETQTVTRRRR